MRNMKKIVLLICVFVSQLILTSCGDEIEFNAPAIQGHKNGDLWKATFFAADIDGGGFVIEGRMLNERIQLITTNDVRGTFELGLESGNVANYVDADGTVYSTRNAPDTNLFLYPPEGQIIVDDIDALDPKGVYGTFWFNAYTADGSKVINFNRGVFYKTPLLGGLEQIQ
jgi:hypothetical protein